MPAKNIDILLIEDEKKFRENTRNRLEKRGYKVHEVERGDDAIKQVRQYDYDVILLDLKMPGMSGEDTLKEIKKHSPSSQVIILTGNASFQSATVTGRLDAYSYLEKPVDFEELLEEIEAAKRQKITALICNDEIAEKGPSFIKRMVGVSNYRPLFIVIGLLMFFLIVIAFARLDNDLVGASENR